ncbi:unnamed protein product, partial [Rotaria magnacalcarata]
ERIGLAGNSPAERLISITLDTGVFDDEDNNREDSDEDE